MERIDEEGETQESSRRGAGQVRRAGSQRGQTAGQPGKWPQGRPGQKPQEDNRGAPQCTSATPWASEELVNTVNPRSSPKGVSFRIKTTPPRQSKVTVKPANTFKPVAVGRTIASTGCNFVPHFLRDSANLG